MSFIVTVWTLSPWIIFKYCVSYVLASRKKSVRTPVYEKRFIVQMSLYFTNINRSTDQISLKEIFCLLHKVRLFIRKYLRSYKGWHNHPLKGLIALEVRPPIKLISLQLTGVSKWIQQLFTSNFSILQIFSPFSCIFFVSLQAGSDEAAFFLA